MLQYTHHHTHIYYQEVAAMPQIVPVYGDVTPDLISRDIAVVCFTPAELSSADRGLHRADTLISSCLSAGKSGRGNVVVAYSYEDDPREIYEIPDVTAHIKYLFGKLPQLPYFFPDDILSVKALLLAVYGAEVYYVSDGTAHVGIRDIDSARLKSKSIQTAVDDYARSVSDRAGGRRAISIIQSLGV